MQSEMRIERFGIIISPMEINERITVDERTDEEMDNLCGC
jgi:hypothetical protein